MNIIGRKYEESIDRVARDVSGLLSDMRADDAATVDARLAAIAHTKFEEAFLLLRKADSGIQIL